MKTLVIFDLEATCWEERTDKKNEIIEIGAVKLDKETGELIDEFDLFVKPRTNPILSDYCKELTSITQEQVNSGYDLAPALQMFNDWVGDTEYIMSWGYYDKNQILRETTDKNIDLVELETKLASKHLNAKNQFSHIFGSKRCGILKALKMLHLEFEGTHNRGIDDCKNIARIYNSIKNKFFETIYDAD